jgi:PAS domain S-box-containing protein
MDAVTALDQDWQTSAAAACATPVDAQQLLRLMPLPCWVVDAVSLAVLEANRAAEEAYGYARDEFLGLSWSELAGSADACRSLTTEPGGAGAPSYWILRTRRGDRVAAEIRAHEIAWSGRPVYLVFATDITRQREATLEMQLVYECLEAAGDMIVVTAADPDVRGERPIVYVNRAFEQRTGYTRAEAIGRDAKFLQGPLSDPDAVARLRRAIARWEPVTVELVNYTKAGEAFWIEMTLTPTADERGWYHYWFAVESDITERKQLQQSLLDSNDELERRVADRTRELRNMVRDLEAYNRMVSHDLQNPLNGVRGFTELLQMKHAAALPADASRMLGLIQRSADHMHRVIEDLLALSRINTMLPRPALVDLVQMAQAILDKHRAQEPTRQVLFESAEAAPLLVDRQLLQIICEQVLGNAWKYTRQQPEALLSLHTRPCEAGVVVTFCDNGIGLDASAAQALFGPFQRQARARPFEGTGIGLAIVARAADRLSGWVWADSPGGAGMRIHLFLPVQPLPPTHMATMLGALGHDH